MKYCKDCKHFVKYQAAIGGYSPIVKECTHPNNIIKKQDYISPEREKSYKYPPQTLRKDSFWCGPEAKWWEPCLSYKVKSFFGMNKGE